MASFIIEGGHLLKGTITPQGAKNEALQVICATLLTHEAVTIQNIPDIRDVNNLIQLLCDIGVKVSRGDTGIYTFQADSLKGVTRSGVADWTPTSSVSRNWAPGSTASKVVRSMRLPPRS